MDNSTALLRHMDGVLGGFFCRKEGLTVTELRGYVYLVTESGQGVREGSVNQRRERGMIFALFVCWCHLLWSGGMTHPGSALFASRRRGRQGAHDERPTHMLCCMCADARVAYRPVLLAVCITLELSFSNSVGVETPWKADV